MTHAGLPSSASPNLKPGISSSSSAPPASLLPSSSSPPSSPLPALAASSNQDLRMESLTPGGHRRRRSSLANSGIGSPTTPQPHARSPRSSRASLIMNHATSATATGGARQGRTTISEEEGDNDAFGGGNDGAAAKANRPRRQGRPEAGRTTDHDFGGDGNADTDDSKDDDDSDEDDRDDHGDGDALADRDLQNDEETGLTAKGRARRKRRRRRNSQLDQRLVRGGSGARRRLGAGDTRSGLAAKPEGIQSVAKSLAINGVLIGLWYFFSLSISLYNKWMFDDSQLNFPFPMFTTSLHMAVQFFLALAVLYFIPSLRPQHAYRKSQPRFGSSVEKPLMTNMFYLTRIGPCGAATSLDIGLGNTSLKYITLTFYTMCKSSSLAFVLLFAFLFRLETPTWRLVAVIATMTLGVLMMVAGEVEFRLGGFLLVISAAFFSGFRWGLTQILLLRNPATSNPFSSIFFLSPIMFLTLLLIAVPAEGVGPLLGGIRALADEKGWLVAPALLIFPGVIAFLMTASEFALLKRTSVVTLSIAGIFKEAVTISAAALVFGDTMTAINVLGLITTLAAIGAYNYIKINKMRRAADAEAQGKKNLPGGGARRDWGFQVVPIEDEDADAGEDDRGYDDGHSPRNRRQEKGIIGGVRLSWSATGSLSSPSTSGTDAEGGGSGSRGGGGASRGRGGGASSGEEARALRTPTTTKAKGKERMDAARAQQNESLTLFTADGDTVPRPAPSLGLLGIDGAVALDGKTD